MEGTPSTSGLSKAGAKAARETSCANLQAPKREDVRGGLKGTSERKTRRTGGKSASKEAAKKGNAAKEITPARESERSDRTSNVSLSSAGTGQLVQSNEMQHYGHIEGVFQQPFTDLQQVQLRAQIFVYGALIQGTVPDEAYMISAFGGPDGGRTIWENAWRAGTERVHGKKSLLVSPETPLQSHIGAKTSDQSIKQNTLQSKATSSPASRSTSKGTPTTSIVNPIIPLSSPLWSIRTPSGDALQPTGFPRGAVMDYQLAISPLHPSATRNLIGHNSSWMSQSPFRGPWTPQTSAFDGNAGFPVRPITEAVNSNPGIASVPHSSSMKQVSAVPVVQSGSPANIFAGTPLLDTKKATLKPGHHSADPKPRKRKKSTVPEESGQSIPHFQSESHWLLLWLVRPLHLLQLPFLLPIYPSPLINSLHLSLVIISKRVTKNQIRGLVSLKKLLVNTKMLRSMQRMLLLLLLLLLIAVKKYGGSWTSTKIQGWHQMLKLN
ncbi:hypothetical protein ERO13_A12G216333v2 [Gossypium hirsutum]|nr:hypothetical protein ERO13_A12G216333v2 [Gossypium hirsutum]